MSLQAEPSPPRYRRLIIVLVALVAILGLIAFALTRGGDVGDDTAAPASTSASASPAVTPSDSPTASPRSIAPDLTATTPVPTPSASPAATAPSDCTGAASGFVPARFAIESLDADEPVVALNLDDEGNIAAPPPNEPRTAAWWSGGPQPGSGRGKALLSIHTYNDSLPPALGNELYEGGQSQLKPGDVIRLYGADGQVQCYEFTEAKKVWVKDYDPNSDVMVDFEGPEELAIIICWDFDDASREWDSRIFFYATPITV